MPGLDVISYAGVLHSSTEETILPTPWSHLADLLKRRNRVVHRVRGDGICFINAVDTCLEQDHNITIQISETINIILPTFDWQPPGLCSVSCSTRPEQWTWCNQLRYALNEAIDFFQNRNYNKDIVDLLVTITAYALDLDFYIYQNNQGKIQVLKYLGDLYPNQSTPNPHTMIWNQWRIIMKL